MFTKFVIKLDFQIKSYGEELNHVSSQYFTLIDDDNDVASAYFNDIMDTFLGFDVDVKTFNQHFSLDGGQTYFTVYSSDDNSC